MSHLQMEQEVFWVGGLWIAVIFVLIIIIQSYPDLQPLYEAARSYLEIPQRVHLLNTRVEVR